MTTAAHQFGDHATKEPARLHGDELVPMWGGTVHNLSDQHCRVRGAAVAREGARCEACAKATTYGMSDSEALALIRGTR